MWPGSADAGEQIVDVGGVFVSEDKAIADKARSFKPALHTIQCTSFMRRDGRAAHQLLQQGDWIVGLVFHRGLLGGKSAVRKGPDFNAAFVDFHPRFGHKPPTFKVISSLRGSDSGWAEA